ncbi:hypothetical protein [Absidia glauca]|uniref:Uncharacterized protein n=1 Tax=Absidia glauca TaxID=4829 RepID=A0A163JGJ6_ABSGL|nr:hypothetical protein [Absidia glauca]
MSDQNLINKLNDYEEEMCEVKTQLRTTVNLSGRLVSMVKDLTDEVQRLSSTLGEMNSQMVGTTVREPPAASPEAVPRLYEKIPPLAQPRDKDNKRKRVENFKDGAKRVMCERWSGNSLSGPLSEDMIEAGYIKLYRKAGDLVKDLGPSLYGNRCRIRLIKDR